MATNGRPGEGDETLGGPPTTQNRVSVPDDLPEHSLVSYNPNRTRFANPISPARTGATEDSENTLLPDQVATEYLTGPEAEPAGPIRAEDRHRLVRLIGRGGCGEVWEAIQVQLDRPVAVKTLREDRFRGTAREQTRADLVRNFREEALIAARLDHPNIVPVYDYGGEADGSPQLTMKLVRGEPWDKMLKADREELGFDDFLAKHLAILAAVANAVAFAHSRHIVHRDIKPSQVMVGEYGEVLLMDWGLAVVVGDGGTLAAVAAQRPEWFSLPTLATASSPAGTPAYMAPEQTRSTALHIGPWTDIYLLGGCLYCVLTGSGPHEGSASHDAFLKAARGEIRDPRTFHPEGTVPDDLAALAIHALAPDPVDRVPTADEFVHRIEDWISGASRRRESQRLTVQLLAELHAPRTNYSAHVAFIDRIQQAAGLWPGNPDVPELRAHAIEDYAELALDKGDLLLALSQAELLPESPRRTDLLRRIETERVQRKRTRRTLRMAVGTVVALMVLGIAGGIVSLRRIDRERVEAISQKNIADTARMTAEKARKEAEAARAVADSEQLYAQIRYATSLVDAGRHEMARAVLWSIPEAARDWEWAYLLDRSHQALAEFPFGLTQASREGTYFYSVLTDGTMTVRDTMGGAQLARVDLGTSSAMVLSPVRDTHVDVVANRKLLRFTPPDWEEKVLAELPADPVFARRTAGDGNLALMFPDGSAALHEAATGAVRFRTPPVPLTPISIDGDDTGDRLLVAYDSLFRVYRASDGTTETSLAGWMENPTDARLTDRGKSFAVNRGRDFYIYRIEEGVLQHAFLPESGMAAHPLGESVIRVPEVIDAANGSRRDLLPVGRSTTAMAKYVAPSVACYWGGTNGEAGVYNTHDGRIVADLRGFPGEILDMWTSGPEGRLSGFIERVFSTTTDDSTQVWPGTPIRSIAELPGQWSTFRSDGRYAVSISHFDARITDLETGRSSLRVGQMFNIYRGIMISEKRDRIYTFGRGDATGHCFGWEVRHYAGGARIRFVKAGTVTDKLPYLWTSGPDDGRVLIFWNRGEPGELRDADTGDTIAAIPPTGETVTALLITKVGTALIGDKGGLIREVALEDGRELRRIGTGAQVRALQLDSANSRLYVSGADRMVRAYSLGEGEPERIAEMPSGDEPAALLDLSEDGTRLLALNDASDVLVWSAPEGKELLRFRIDSVVHRMELNSSGTRILGLGDSSLGVWDMEGREVARVPEVIDFSLKSRRLLLRTSVSLMSRDVVTELPPYRIEEFPGDSTMTFEERFGLWRREQHRAWWQRKAVAAAPASIRAAGDGIRGTIAENGVALSNDIDSVLMDLASVLREATPSVRELMLKQAALYSADPGHDWGHYANGLWDHYYVFDREPARSLLLNVAPYMEYRNLTQIQRFGGPSAVDTHPWVHRNLAAQLDILGNRETAQAVMRRLVATASLMGHRARNASQSDLQIERRVFRGTLPELPEELRTVAESNFAWERMAWIPERLGLSPDAMPVDQFHVARKAIDEKRDRKIIEWLDKVAPIPDLTAELERARAKFPPPPPGDMLLSEFMGDVLDRLEREQLGGLTAEEAFEEAGRRFDESVEKFDAEFRDAFPEEQAAGS